MKNSLELLLNQISNLIENSTEEYFSGFLTATYILRDIERLFQELNSFLSSSRKEKDKIKGAEDALSLLPDDLKTAILRLTFHYEEENKID